MQHVRVAVVTGASSGIGLAAARTLASQGWRVIGTGRDPQRTASADAQIRAAAAPGVPADMIRVDLASMTDVARAAREIAALTGHIENHRRMDCLDPVFPVSPVENFPDLRCPQGRRIQPPST